MTTLKHPEPAESQPGDSSVWLEVQQSAEFVGLRRTLRRFIFPMTAAFLLWYTLYVIMSAYARDFMSIQVIGNINVGLIFGLLQFVTTFLIAWLYERFSSKKLEPVSDRLRVLTEEKLSREAQR